MSAYHPDYGAESRVMDEPITGVDRYEWGSHLPTLCTKRLSLRPISATDVADMFAVFSDPDVMRYWDGTVMLAPRDALTYIEHIHQAFRRRQLFQWGIADRSSDALLGTCTLTHVSPGHQRCEIGFALRRTRWGQGLGSEAVSALVAFTFDRLQLHRVEADVDPRNDRSLRLLEGLGFRREGYLRERYFLNGERQDAVLMGLLRSEWRDLRRSASA